MKGKDEQCIQDFDATLKKVCNMRLQFLRHELKLFTSKAYANFVIMEQF